jgi:hypothetical protein
MLVHVPRCSIPNARQSNSCILQALVFVQANSSSPSCLARYALLVQLLVVRKLYWSGVYCCVGPHDHVFKDGVVPVKSSFVFLSLAGEQQLLFVILSCVAKFFAIVWIWSRRSRSSVVVRILLLPGGIAASGNQECISLSSLVIAQDFRSCSSHCSSFAFGKQCTPCVLLRKFCFWQVTPCSYYCSRITIGRIHVTSNTRPCSCQHLVFKLLIRIWSSPSLFMESIVGKSDIFF